MRRKNKSIYIVLIMVALICITIGYAVLNTTLNINGKSTISKNTWDVYFDNIVVNNGSVETEKIPTITDKTTVDFEVTLNLPGDYYEFNVDVVNDGTIDAMIESIEKTPELTEAQAKYLSYTINYENGDQIATKQLVRKKEFVRLKVRVELRKDIDPSDLPEVGDVLYLSFTTNYVQADDNGVLVNDNGVKIIQFKIGRKYYQAENYMSWNEWIKSPYNTDGFLYNTQLMAVITSSDKRVLTSSGGRVLSDRVIKEDEIYNIEGLSSTVITFYIEGFEMNAYSGMTWEQFVECEFNMDEYGEQVYFVSPTGYAGVSFTKDGNLDIYFADDNGRVRSTDVIKEGYNYLLNYE